MHCGKMAQNVGMVCHFHQVWLDFVGFAVYHLTLAVAVFVSCVSINMCSVKLLGHSCCE